MSSQPNASPANELLRVHSRTKDEKQVAKLLKDITSGALRRRKGPDDEFDLDDSDDERLARRREKQREFARMRKALMADEKIGEIAENPKKAAFFKAIEDHNSDDDVGFDFLDANDINSQGQADTSQEAQPDSQQQPLTRTESNKRKRPLEPSAEDIANRPPPHLRRTPAAMSKKPASLAEIRETVSFLTERPEYDSFQEDASMEDEHADHNNEKDTPTAAAEPEEERPQSRDGEFAVPAHPRRTKGPVVDRLALLRQASSNSANSGSSSANTRLAFHAGGSAADPTFRPPSFTRRTTAGSTTSTSTSSSTSSKSDSSRVSKPGGTGTKKGAVNYYTAAREKEREKELRMKQRSGKSNIAALLNKHASNKLGVLGGGQWD